SLFGTVRRRPASTLFPYTTLFRSLAYVTTITMISVNTTATVSAAPGLFQPATTRPLSYAAATAPASVHPAPTKQPITTAPSPIRSEEHTSELQSRENLVCRLLLEK